MTYIAQYDSDTGPACRIIRVSGTASPEDVRRMLEHNGIQATGIECMPDGMLLAELARGMPYRVMYLQGHAP